MFLLYEAAISIPLCIFLTFKIGCILIPKYDTTQLLDGTGQSIFPPTYSFVFFCNSFISSINSSEYSRRSSASCSSSEMSSSVALISLSTPDLDSCSSLILSTIYLTSLFFCFTSSKSIISLVFSSFADTKESFIICLSESII